MGRLCHPFAVAMLSASFSSCAPAQAPLPSPDALGAAVVEALNSGNPENLHRLRVTQEVYKQILWPEFPESNSNFTADFAWGNLNQKCIEGMKKWARRYGKLDLDYVGLRFERPMESYDTFKLHRGTVLTVRLNGEKKDLKILGSVIERHGGYTLLSYDD